MSDVAIGEENFSLKIGSLLFAFENGTGRQAHCRAFEVICQRQQEIVAKLHQA